MNEQGSGTILSIGLILVLSLGFLISLTKAELLSSQVRIQQLVDQIALDASHAQRGIISGFPCELANQVAKANLAKIELCEVTENTVRLELHAEHVGIVLRARALAGF
ncbi:MAG: hypothetical protein RI933_719 [Actinomycetota bacterium]